MSETKDLPERDQPRAKAVEIGVYRHGDALAYIVTLAPWVDTVQRRCYWADVAPSGRRSSGYSIGVRPDEWRAR